MKASEVWGAGPFDNAIAQTWAFKLKTEHTIKALPLLVGHFETPARDAHHALEIVALAEFWNLVAGHSPHASSCPLLTEWVVSQKIKPLGDGALDSAPAQLRDIGADPKIAKLFGKMAADWRSEVERTAKTIEAGKKPRPVKSDAISIKALKTVVGGKRGWEPGLLYPMERGSDDVHINLLRPLSPQYALAMARYPSVVSLRLDLSKKSEEAASVVPFRILLQRWSDCLTRFDFDVAPKTWYSTFLDNFVPELGMLPKFEVFKTVHFDVSDDVVAALAKSPALQEIRISCDGNGPTAAALDALRVHKSMKILWLRGARISKKEAAAFAKAHPKIYVSINEF